MQELEKERNRRLSEMRRFDILKDLSLSNIFSLYEQALFEDDGVDFTNVPDDHFKAYVAYKS